MDAVALEGLDAPLFCLGVAAARMSEVDCRVPNDLMLAVAGFCAARSPGMALVYLSGAGTDSTEHGRAM